MIVGFSLQHVDADKHEPARGNINVNYRHTVEDVEGAEVAAVDDTVARISFTFQITYQKDDDTIAEINFDGTVLWQRDADDLIERWEDDDELSEDVASAVANHIFRKCLTQAVGLADALDMRSPVPMPTIN